MRGRHRSSHLGLLLLFSQLYQVGLDNIPPVTLAVLGLNAYLFLFPAAPLMKACVSVHQAYWSGEWRRLLLSPFHHADDMHLYFNMVSFVMKGIRLERRLGAVWFAYVLAVFSLLTGALYLALEAGLTHLTDDQSYSAACAVGFSGVIFSLKVLNNYYHPGGVTYVMGFPVSNRYASWVELVLIHITAPGTSLIGHLAGILVGLLYTAGPLKKMMKMCAGLMSSRTFMARTHFTSSGYSGRSSRSDQYMADDGTSRYTGGMTEEEQLAAAIRNSLHGTGGSSSWFAFTCVATVMGFMSRKWKLLLLFNMLGLVAIFYLSNTKRSHDDRPVPDVTKMMERRPLIEPVTEQEPETTTMEPERTGESVQDSLRERLRYLEDIVFKHLSGLSKSLGLVEGFDAPGGDGVPFTLSPKDQFKAELQKDKYGYDAIMSDKISLDRTIPDFRPSKCKEYTYPTELPGIALIFIFVNEALSVILRSIHSAVNHTPAHLLKEIILVDDYSDDENLKGPLEEYVNKRYPGLVKIIRNKKREGLIRARIAGWNAATAEVIGVFDAHMEFTPFWAEPVLTRIKEDHTRIILPAIDNIDHDTFGLVTYGQPAHGYDWQLWCKYIKAPKTWMALNDDTLPIRTPSMIGCSFVVDRVYFGELGLFDPGMEIYGGENVELGIRVWTCGGSMEMLPCSRVAHITRRNKPYLKDSLAVIMRRNGLRVAEVWMDEYKLNFYMAWNIPMEGHGIDYGNITERVELRKRLQCKNFKWYLDNVYPEMKTHQNTLLYGMMYNFNATNLCLDQGDPMGHAVILYSCHGWAPQLVRYTAINQLFLGQLGNSFIETRCMADILPNTEVQLLDCKKVKNIAMTKWNFKQGQPIRNIGTGRCIEVVPIPTDPFYKVVMQTCSGQRWNLTTPVVSF